MRSCSQLASTKGLDAALRPLSMRTASTPKSPHGPTTAPRLLALILHVLQHSSPHHKSKSRRMTRVHPAASRLGFRLPARRPPHTCLTVLQWRQVRGRSDPPHRLRLTRLCTPLRHSPLRLAVLAVRPRHSGPTTQPVVPATRPPRLLRLRTRLRLAVLLLLSSVRRHPPRRQRVRRNPSSHSTGRTPTS